MKKRILITSVIAMTLLLNGCAARPAQSDETISNQDFTNLHEQLETLQTDVSLYMNTPSASDYKILTDAEMKSTIQSMESSLLLQLDNQTDTSYREVNISLVLYDKDNQILNNTTCYIDNILAGKTCYSSIYCPTDGGNNMIPYDHYDLQIKALPMENTVTDYSDQITVVSNKTTDQGVIAKFTNESDIVLNSVALYVLYKDADGTIIDCETCSLYDMLPGSFDVATFAAPYGKDYETVPYESYELVIASAINTENQNTLPKPQPRMED